MVANRNGFFYVLDRVTGKLLRRQAVHGHDRGRESSDRMAIRSSSTTTGARGACPINWGGTNFMPPSFDPALQLFFVTARETCATYLPVKNRSAPRANLPSAAPSGATLEHRRTARCARSTRRRASGKWEFKFRRRRFAGVMSTASGVVFAGDNEGNFMAFDARTGRNLWHYQTGSPIWGRRADDLHARRPAVCRHRGRARPSTRCARWPSRSSARRRRAGTRGSRAARRRAGG